ncbi:MAG: hypothetical protein QOG64_2765, partial [Acidimicrobiaceae bacterium]|nr:hypothetical protein [Acidimicrobiaceae bacterium]
LVAFLSDGFDAAHPFSRITARPATAGGPELWLLGSSGYSGAYAAHLGVGFSFAHFINPGPGPEVVQFYRDNFQPSQVDGQPRASAAISVICADSDDEAERLAASVGLWRLRLEGGDPGPVPTVERALAHPYTESDRRRMEASRGRSVVGGPERVRKELEAMAEAYGIDELIVVTIVHDHEARLRSYQLLAEACALDS